MKRYMVYTWPDSQEWMESEGALMLPEGGSGPSACAVPDPAGDHVLVEWPDSQEWMDLPGVVPMESGAVLAGEPACLATAFRKAVEKNGAIVVFDGVVADTVSFEKERGGIYLSGEEDGLEYTLDVGPDEIIGIERIGSMLRISYDEGDGEVSTDITLYFPGEIDAREVRA